MWCQVGNILTTNYIWSQPNIYLHKKNLLLCDEAKLYKQRYQRQVTGALDNVNNQGPCARDEEFSRVLVTGLGLNTLNIINNIAS